MGGLATGTGNKRAPYAERGQDLYETPPEAVHALLRLAFLESDRRTPILEGRGLKRIHVFRKRLPMMHRAGWEGRKANSGMAFAWFVWDRYHNGLPEMHRLSWESDA